MATPRLTDAINCRIVGVEQETDEAGRIWTSFMLVDPTDHLRYIRLYCEPGHLVITRTLSSYAPIAADDFEDSKVEAAEEEAEEETLTSIIEGTLSPEERRRRMQALRDGYAARGELDEVHDHALQ